jgi:hypothetical protein
MPQEPSKFRTKNHKIAADGSAVGESKDQKTVKKFGHLLNRNDALDRYSRKDNVDYDNIPWMEVGIPEEERDHNKRVAETKKKSKENLESMKKTAGLKNKKGY